MEELLSRFLEEDLPEAERAAMAEHIAGCARCRDARAAFTMLERLLAARRDEVPHPAAIADAVLARLGARRGRFPAALRWLTPVLAVITVAAAFMPLVARPETIEGIAGKIAAGIGSGTALCAAIPGWIVEAAGGDWRILLIGYLALSASFVVAGSMLCTRIVRE